MRNTNRLGTLAVLLTLVAFVWGGVLGAVDLVQADEPATDTEAETEKAEKSEKSDTSKAETEAKEVKGSDKKGKYYFKKECKGCHGSKGDGGEVTPVSKTIKQWERFFKKDKHGEEKLSEEFEAEQLIHIKTFLINHAADSDQPETCG